MQQHVYVELSCMKSFFARMWLSDGQGCWRTNAMAPLAGVLAACSNMLSAVVCYSLRPANYCRCQTKMQELRQNARKLMMPKITIRVKIRSC